MYDSPLHNPFNTAWHVVERKPNMEAGHQSEESSPLPGVLIIDDDEHVRMLLRSVLTRSGWAVWTAADGVQALSIYKQNESNIQVVLMDFHMPGLDGLETLHFLRRISPDIVCCFMSGMIPDETRAAIAREPNAYLLAKPFPINKLSGHLNDLLAKSPQRS
jgi:CheY-like chemotaxis protein